MLAKKKARLKREFRKTARSAAGLTPLGTALTINELASNATRLIKSGKEYGSTLLREGKKRGKKIGKSMGL